MCSIYPVFTSLPEKKLQCVNKQVFRMVLLAILLATEMQCKSNYGGVDRQWD